ncbi:MAG: alkaline phosphatase [Clostridia bacterium]|nr:alkaline phosphatase [Clostridia bacterium]
MKKVLSLVLAFAMILSVSLAYTVSSAEYMVGDINGDNRIDSRDSNCLVRFLSGTYSVSDERCTDINGDGKTSISDASYLLRALCGNYVIVQPGEDVSGISIAEYTVVYPENATVYEIYAAEILCDWISDNCGYELECVTDSADEVEYEILIGATNRAESNTGAEFSANQYMLKADGTKLVMQGKDYMIGGAVGELTYYKMNEDCVDVDSIATENTVLDYTPVDGDGVILMIGDGMGFNHIKFTRFYLGRNPVEATPYEGFIAESFPNSGEAITYCLSEFRADFTFNKITTDSAAAATALSSGWKTQKGYLGIDAFGGNVINIREVAHNLGYKTAVISTEGTTGATPAGFTVHTSSRANAEDIIAQQTALVENGEITYLKGESHEDLLSDTKTALDLVSTDSEGFFVMIEEAYIDKASHKLGEDYTLGDLAHYVYRFNLAIQYAATFTASRPDTVLIVTADHETGSLTASGGYDSGGNHSNVNVPVFAMGYDTEYFNGVAVDNTDIADFMARAFGLETYGGAYGNVNE